ncbi:MAG: hypothetical protein KDD40_10125, partial [Bdellovibrionales bacterium]|nr:hypothetical protein [Bdellovibrionales bacterium]
NQGIIRVNNKDYLNRKTFLALSLAELIALFNSSASEDVLEKIDQRRSEIATLAQKELEDMQVQTSIDISNALVINIGNLNNAYPTPTEGMSLNDWRKLSQHQVTKGHILSKLLEIFSPQNVSRLGSNHIAFHPIDSQSLKKLIKKHLHQNSQNLKGVKVNFSLDFYNRVQQEFDIQELGIRALENLISQFTAEGLKQLSQYLNSNDRLNVTEIYIDTNSSALQATWTVKSGNGSKLAEFSFDIPSDKAKLFTPLPPIQRAENSVLAAAYTLLNMVIFKEVPDIVRLRSGKNKNNILVSSFSDSSMSIRYPEERSLYLAYKFAERAASQLAFGQKKWIDSQEITKFAIDSVRGYGIEREQNSGEVIAGFTRDLSPSTHDDRVIIDTQLVKLDELHFEKEVTREIENAMALSSEILRREEKFFKALIRALRFESMELRYEDIIKIAKMSWSSQADLTEIIQFDQRRRESSEPIVYRNFDCEAALNSYLLDEPNN